MTSVMRKVGALFGTEAHPADAAPEPITFHPELLIRWDDETAYRTHDDVTSECERPARLAHRPAMPSPRRNPSATGC